MTCANCGMDKRIHARGLCHTCYQYQRKFGKPRPRKAYDRPKFCRTCKQEKVHANGECVACYTYRRANGKRRPAYKWQEHCRVCGAPRRYRRWCRGRCDACSTYYRKTGVERPSRLWKRYCDCGSVATHLDVELQMMTVDRELPKVERYDLCEDCYQLETGE